MQGWGKTTFTLGGLGAIIAMLALAPPASAAPHDTVLLSRADGVAGAQADGATQSGTTFGNGLSADGCRAAFLSDADNLNPDAADNAFGNAFVRDHCTGETFPVNVDDAGTAGTSSVSQVAISPDGNFVAFSVEDTFFGQNDSNGINDIYVRDIAASDTELVSAHRTTGDAAGGGFPAISEDGLHVAFSTGNPVDAYVAGISDTNPGGDIVVAHTGPGTYDVASLASPTSAGNDGSANPSISAAGNVVSFTSQATDLTEDGPVEDENHVYVWTQGANPAVELVDRADGANGRIGNAGGGGGRVSGDGSTVSFDSTADNLVEPGEELGGGEQVYVRLLGSDETELVSRASGRNGAISDNAQLASLSFDGRRVVFESADAELDPDFTTNGIFQAFMRDRSTATTTMVSRASGVAGAVSDSASLRPVISANHRFITFISGGTNLVPPDANAADDLFRREQPFTPLAEETELASRADGPGGAAGDDDSYLADISSDGCRLAMLSNADNLNPDAADNGLTNGFVRDLCTGETFPVSLTDGGAAADDDTSQIAISPDGGYVAIATHADNLDAGDGNGDSDVYVYDIAGAEMELVSFDPASDLAQGARHPAISENGDRVAFTTDSNVSTFDPAISDSNGSGLDVVVRDRGDDGFLVASVTGPDATATPSGSSQNASTSGDGTVVAFQSDATDVIAGGTPGSATEVYYRDTDAGTTALVSRADGAGGVPAGGFSTSEEPDVSEDGDTVTFTSDAPELFDDGAPHSQVYARDLSAGNTELVSRQSGQNGLPADDTSGGSDDERGASVSGDGRFVLFRSLDQDLGSGSRNATSLYMRDRLNQTTFLVSRGSGETGLGSEGTSEGGEVAGGGGFMAFESDGRLTFEDGLATRDVFRRGIDEPDNPTEGETVNLRTVAGDVYVKVPGGEYEPLTKSTQIPIGSLIDTRAGQVELTDEYNGVYESVIYYDAIWKVRQKEGPKPYLEMKLADPKTACAGAKASKAKGSVGKKGYYAKGWGSGRGRHRTRGGRGSGTVRGTRWSTANRCDRATKFFVAETTTGGKGLAVDDFGKRGRVNAILKAGDSYLARPK